MLRIDTPEIEFFDEATNTFETIKPQHLQLEHSLLSASKWEARWRIPFLDGKERTRDQMIDYIYCMTINHNVDKRVYDVLPQEILDKISDYIETPQTATTFSSDRASEKGRGYGGHHQIITTELIYWEMSVNNIPFSCEKWHLSRLLTLIRVCGIKNSNVKKKRSKDSTIRRNAALNKQRRQKLGTSG